MQALLPMGRGLPVGSSQASFQNRLTDAFNLCLAVSSFEADLWGERKMEELLSIEELAKQELKSMAYAYSLFVKNLMDEGFDRNKVRRASDRAWAITGMRRGAQIKSVLGTAKDIDALEKASEMAASLHGIEFRREVKEGVLHLEFVKCPWHEACESIGIPDEWKFCPTGHAAYSESMLQSINPLASFDIPKCMPNGDDLCSMVVSFYNLR